jgi:hypothetical protein
MSDLPAHPAQDASSQEPPRRAFASFFERDAFRRKQRRGRTTFIVSIALHAVALIALAVYSLLDVDELWGPSVKVKVYSRQSAPAEALNPVPPPAPSARP